VPEERKQLLVLDLDETLIYATERPLGRPPDFQVEPYHVYKRPHVDEFISRSADWFELAVWSTSSEDYADAITGELFPFHIRPVFVWARGRCTTTRNRDTDERYWIKDLKKLKRHGYPLERVVVVDDSAEKLQRNYGNLVRVRPYTGQSEDDELMPLLEFLKRLVIVPDVRKIEKRNWRTF
jgi:RNA polymerase II subunit A small phosphatase-like protein